MSEIETHTMIAVSSEHLRPSTHAAMRAAAKSGQDEDLPLFYMKEAGDDHYGYFVPLCAPEEVALPSECPDELAGLMAWGRESGATWLMIDRDAGVVEGLPFFDQTDLAPPPEGVPVPLPN